MTMPHDMDLPSTFDVKFIDRVLLLPRRRLYVWLYRVDPITFISEESQTYFISKMRNADVTIIRDMLPHLNDDTLKKLIPVLEREVVINAMVTICHHIGFSTKSYVTREQNIIALLLLRICEWDITDTDMVLDAMIKSQVDKNYPDIFRRLENRNGLGKELMRQKLDSSSNYFFWDRIFKSKKQ